MLCVARGVFRGGHVSAYTAYVEIIMQGMIDLKPEDTMFPAHHREGRG